MNNEEWDEPENGFEKCENCGSEFGERCNDPFLADVWNTFEEVVLCLYCYNERSAEI